MHHDPLSDTATIPLSSALEWLDEVWSGTDGRDGQVMPMDVRETDSGYVVEVGLPGVKPTDVEVTLDGRLLTIRGRAGDKQDRDEGRYLLRERRVTSFTRSVTLPAEIDGDAVSTTFEDGELCVSLPISKRAGSRRIPIGTAASEARQVQGASDASEPAGGQTNAAQSTAIGQRDGRRDAEVGAVGMQTSE